MKRKSLLYIFLSACLMLAGCNLPGASGTNPNMLSTAAAQTVEAVLATPLASATLPIGGPPLVTATPTAVSCEERTEIVSWTRDGDIYDAEEADRRLAVDSSFTMRWEVKNLGTCVWDDTYKFVFDSGAPLTVSTSLPVMPKGYTVKTGETLTITVAMKAPATAGRFDSGYSLTDAASKDVLSFGIITNVGSGSSGSLAAPSELRYTYDCTSGSVQIGLTWLDNSSDEDGFRIYRDSAQIGETGAGVTSFQDIAPTVGKFKYTIAAFNGSGESSASMNVETKNCE
jgi:hypothetical protein